MRTRSTGLLLLLALLLAGTTSAQQALDFEVKYRYSPTLGGAPEVAVSAPIHLGMVLGTDMGLVPRARVRLSDPLGFEVNVQALAETGFGSAFVATGVDARWGGDPIWFVEAGARFGFTIGR